jgi:DnaJ-class molecular chaperone
MANYPNCNGYGELEGPPGIPRISMQTKTCPTCRGSGEVPTDIARWLDIRPECDGWRTVGMMINPSYCPTCRGRGMISRVRRRVI